jgi:nucleoside-diphosphate-sugar epimerase
VVDALLGHVGSYVFISSGSVYKSVNLYPWQKESPRWRTIHRGAYGWGKKRCEDLLLSAHAKHVFRALNIRQDTSSAPITRSTGKPTSSTGFWISVRYLSPYRCGALPVRPRRRSGPT